MKKSKSSKTESEQTPPNVGDKKHFIVVGLGASAGGVLALKEFFSAMSPNSGMAFVVILHLSPQHESNLAEILQTYTKMPVIQVTETVKVEPDCVYVIPPHQQLLMVDGTVQVGELERQRGTRVAIDLFFRTLADAYGRKAVGIVLSGSGTDGTLGIKRIKENDGFVIVQDLVDAEYDSMPRSAIETNLVDWVLPVAQIPEKLIAFRESSEKLHLTDGDDTRIAKEIKSGKALRDILAMLRVRTGHDFSNYKQATLIRRIARHLQIHELEDIPSYLQMLRDKPDELNSLLKNLLINVTSFFRDKEAWEVLENTVIPNLFAGKTSEQTVRVWSVGCASGEEAYSLAIILGEYANQLSDPPKFQVFATDVDDEAISEAREHRYTEGILADVTPERLRQFFVKEGNSFTIKKELRERVLFAPHNILRDPPFSRIDLIVCRNLLIYLNRDTQEKVLEIFHFALNRDGYLFLGNSETAEGFSTLYSPIDKKQRIYVRRPTSNDPYRATPYMPLQERWNISFPEINHLPEREAPISFGEIHYKLVEKYAPPSVLVDEEAEVVHMSESAGKFFQFSGGEPSNNLFKLIHKDLLADLRAAIFSAHRDVKPVEFQNIRVNLNGNEMFVNLIVRPVSIVEAGRDYLLVIFDESVVPPFDARHKEKDTKKINQDDAMDAIVRALEEDLRRTKDRLRTTIEQHETSIEELKAANEELQAINEELRSASEELETSKEELQSVNEELITVNHELKDKVDEISRANSDLQNFMSSTDIATIFLDRSLNIKRYTPPAQQLFSIMPTDIGRPLEHFTNKLNYPNIAQDADEVLRTLKPSEHEVQSAHGKFYIARFVPYRTQDDRIDGVVLNFIDITERKQADAAIEEDFRDTRLLQEVGARLTTEADIQTLYQEVLSAAILLLRADAGTVQICDENTEELVLIASQGFEPEMTEKFRRVDAGSQTSCGIALRKNERSFVDYDVPESKDPDGSLRIHREAGFLSGQSTPLVTRAGKTIGMLSTHWREHRRLSEREVRFLNLLARQAADLIEQRQSDERLHQTLESLQLARDAEETYRTLFESMDEGFCTIEVLFDDDGKAVDYRFLQVNPAFERQTGIENAVGRRMREIVPLHEEDWFEIYGRVALTGEPVRFENEAAQLGRWYDVYAFRIDDPELHRVGVLFNDVIERKHAEEALRESENALRKSEERLRLIMESAEDYAIMSLDNEGRYTEWNTGAERMFRFTEEEAIGQSSEIIFTPEDCANGVPAKELQTARDKGRAPDERFHMRKDGTRFYVSGVMVALRDGNELIGFAKIARDLSERRMMEEALREADRRKDEFLATLAHELRNPLAPIRSGIEIIRQATLDKEARMQALETIERQTNQVVHLVDDLLDISRITQGKINLKKKKIELSKAVEMAVETVKSLYDPNERELTISIPAEPIYLNADLTRISQVLLNILTNAVKYSTPGDKISLVAETEGEQVVISVKDTGIGIPPEMLPQIFDMFMQIDSSKKQARGGLGIGLSVVKKLVELHGGSIEAFSEGEQKGSEFIICLPLSSKPSKDEGRTENVSENETVQLQSLKLSESKEIEKSNNHHRILVIDDNEDAAEMLRVLLNIEGHEVEVVYDGESGVKLAKEFKPDACLVDIGLPEMSGYDVAVQLRKMLPESLLISISGWGQEEDRQRSSKAGFNHHLVKPVEIEDINKLLNE